MSIRAPPVFFSGVRIDFGRGFMGASLRHFECRVSLLILGFPGWICEGQSGAEPFENGIWSTWED
jgi:hypothetical protein